MLVPPDAVSRTEGGDELLTIRTANARDATHDDLARGGYVPVERAEKAEWSARVARMAMENEHQDREGVRIRKDLGTQDAPCPCDTDPEQGMGMHSPPCPLHEAARALRRKTSWEDAAHTMDGELKAAITRAEKAERERDDAVAAHRSALAEQTARADTNFRAALKVQGDMTDLRVALSAAESANAEGHELLAAETARAEKAEGLLIQRETELRLAREDGAAVERQMREARSAADASFVRANQAEKRAEKAEKRAEKAERLRAECESVLTAMGDRAREAELALAESQAERESSFLRAKSAEQKAEKTVAERAESKAAQYERDWYAAKAEFGAAMAKRSAQVARLTAALHGLVAADTARGGDCPSCGVDDSALCLPGCAVNEALAALGEP